MCLTFTNDVFFSYSERQDGHWFQEDKTVVDKHPCKSRYCPLALSMGNLSRCQQQSSSTRKTTRSRHSKTSSFKRNTTQQRRTCHHTSHLHNGSLFRTRSHGRDEFTGRTYQNMLWRRQLSVVQHPTLHRH